MKRIINICLLFLLIFNCFTIFCNVSYAKPDKKIDTLISNAKSAENAMNPGDDEFFKGINKVIALLQIIGTGIAIIVVSIIGIKYMLASPGEKAETKKLIMPTIIGCVLVFGGVQVVAIVAKFVVGVTK